MIAWKCRCVVVCVYVCGDLLDKGEWLTSQLNMKNSFLLPSCAVLTLRLFFPAWSFLLTILQDLLHISVPATPAGLQVSTLPCIHVEKTDDLGDGFSSIWVRLTDIQNSEHLHTHNQLTDVNNQRGVHRQKHRVPPKRLNSAGLLHWFSLLGSHWSSLMSGMLSRQGGLRPQGIGDAFSQLKVFVRPSSSLNSSRHQHSRQHPHTVAVVLAECFFHIDLSKIIRIKKKD